MRRPTNKQMYFTSLRVIALLCVIGIGACGTVRAASDSWIGTTATTGTFLWSTGGNWNGGAPAVGAVLEFGTGVGASTNPYDNIAGLSIAGMLFDPGAPAYIISGSALTLTGSIGNNSSNVQTINNAITFSEPVNSVFTFGTGGIVFGGLVTATPSGAQGNGWLFNAPLTTFSGGFSSNTGGGRTVLWSGTGNILLNSPLAITSGSNAGVLGLIYQGSGTLTLSPGAGNGSISGTLSGLGAALQIGSGAADISGTTGNSTLLISGNYTIGSAGAATLTIKGAASGASQGTLSLEDNTINTLFINSITAGATVLTMGQSTAAPSVLSMDIGNNSADSILLGSGLKASVAGTNGVLVNLNGIGGLTTSGTVHS